VNTKTLNRILLLCFLILYTSIAVAQDSQYGIKGRRAPSWKVEEWFNLPEGKVKLDLSDYKGKIIYLYCFQSWCPGCYSHGFPTLKAVWGEFKDNPKVTFVAIQTVFEGFGVNTKESAKEVAKKFELDVPFGHDPGPEGSRSAVLQNYRTGGTPWTVIIDQEGVVRYNQFRIEAEHAKQLIQRLLEEDQKTESNG